MTTMTSRVEQWRERAERTLAWQVWERLLEIEFVDRSVALAGKAFVSFFPLVIVVAAFMPPRIRASILTTLTRRIGVQGDELATVKQAFTSTDDIRRATGVLGLVLAFFFAASFTTALQRVYLRAWQRPQDTVIGKYTRGPVWMIAMLVFMAVLGFIRGAMGDGAGVVLFVVPTLLTTCGLWWFTAWLMLQGSVRWRVLVPTALITGVAMSVYTVSATFWMPKFIVRNEEQFGFFGVALVLVTWFSGAAFCVLLGACAGPVLASDNGWIGRLTRGANPELLVDGSVPSLPAPQRPVRLSDAFRPAEDEVDGR